MKNIARHIIAGILCFTIISVMIASAFGVPYFKPEYPDYAPSGMPDFDQKQDGWYYGPTGQWVFCGPVAVANSLWWLDSKYEAGATPPPRISDSYGLVTAYGTWDDHDPQNVEPFVNELAGYMHITPGGTEVHNMKQGIDDYLTAKGMHTYLYTHLYEKPTFEQVDFEVERSQDVILLLGFWQYDQGIGWYRFGGHYVTVAGVDTKPQAVYLSDPFLDAAEPPPHGYGWPGIVLPPPVHPHPPVPPDTVHNDALYVSHDYYQAASPSPSPGGLWGFPDYSFPPDVFYNFNMQNFPSEMEPYFGPFNPSLYVYTEVEYAVVTSPWYAKGQYVDYAPSGMPDFDQKQDNWITPHPPNPGTWSYCGPTAVANSMWWYDSKFEPNPVQPPAVNDGFPLVESYATMPPFWDDHDPQNVQPLVQNLAWYMDTDGIRTLIPHAGTEVHDMQAGIAQYLSDKGVNPLGDANGDGIVDNQDMLIVTNALSTHPGQLGWDMRADVVHDNVINMMDVMLVTAHFGEKWGKFYEKTVNSPTFEYLEHQIKMCEDVVLLLGFWQEVSQGYFLRVGGHFVTAHGVDSADMTIAISDPFQDNAEKGGQGRVIPDPPHNHPAVPPDTIHNDALYVSHDYYKIGPSPSPGGIFGLIDYNWSAGMLNNFYAQNVPREFSGMTPEPWMGFPIYVEIEYSVIVSCHGPMVAAGTEDGNVYGLDYMGNLLWSSNLGQVPVVSVAMSERGEYVVAGALSTSLNCFNGSTGANMWNAPLGISESYDGDWRGADSKTVGISADGRYIVAAARDGVYLFDNLGNQIWHYSGEVRPEETIARISSDGRYIVCCNYLTNEVHFFSHLRNGASGWQAADGQPIWTRRPGAGNTYWAAIDGCGRYVAVSAGSYVILYDRAGVSPWNWQFTRAGFVRVDMPWDGRSVVAVNADPTDSQGAILAYFSDMTDGIMGWSVTDGTPQWVLTPAPDSPNNDLYSVAISPEGETIATGPATTTIYLFSELGNPIQTISDGVVNTLDLTFTGEYGVAGDRVEPAPLTGTIHFFSKTRNTILWSFGTTGKINSVAIQKKYPCMEPFPRHDVGITSVTRLVDRYGHVRQYVGLNGRAQMNNVTMSNYGDYIETVEVALYAYSSSNNTMLTIGSQFVTINAGESLTVSFDWTVPSGIDWYGNYTLVATIGPVRDENNLADNEFIDAGLVVTGHADIDGDRQCMIIDIYATARAFGSSLEGPDPVGHPYNPDCDIDGDNQVMVTDYYFVCQHFGLDYP